MAVVLLEAGCGVPSPPPPRPAPVLVRRPPPLVTHGVAAGDVAPDRVVLWARADRPSTLHAVVVGGGESRRASAEVSEAHDDTGKITFEGLHPDTAYRYWMWFSDESSDQPTPGGASAGSFRTAPAPDADVALTFGWSGDLGGLNACRDARDGYPVFRTIDGAKLDFFIGLGDMIYADMGCTAQGLYGNAQIPTPVAASATLRAYWAHWKYNREDSGLKRVMSSTSYYAVWDDHEVTNDFGPHDDWHGYPPYTIGAHLLPLGRRALLDYNPIHEDPVDPDRLYRSFRWGRELHLVLLDTRSYRDANWERDSAEHPKTMLGSAQREWLEKEVTRSDATWKVVVSSVPISVPTGRGTPSAGHDGWAGYDLEVGYERELESIFEKFRDAHVRNLLWLTTDVHFATGFAYHPFPESPEFVVYEVTAGPLGAMLLPTQALDETFHPERLFFFGPTQAPQSFQDATRFMNWGRVALDRSGALTVSIIGGDGREGAHRVLAPALLRR